MAAAAFLLPAGDASAYVKTGCRYQYENDIDLQESVGNNYDTPVDNAVTDWNQSTNQMHIQKNADGNINLVVTDFTTNEDYWAIVPKTFDCPYAANPNPPHSPYHSNESMAVWLNKRTMDDLASYKQRLIITHEIGHALGLAHMPVGCNQTKAVMQQTETKWQCGWSGNAPWADDVNGVEAVY